MRGSTRSIISGGAVMALAILLAGCSAAPGGAPPTPAIATSHTPVVPTPVVPTPMVPVPAPTPTSVPTAGPTDPSSWAIDFDGVGPATLGVPMAVDQASLARLTDTSQAGCAISTFTSPAAPTIILVPDASGTVTAIGVYGRLWTRSGQGFGETPRTFAGIGADSTLTELLTAYPTIQKTGQYSFLDYYAITNGSGHWIVFAVDTESGAIWGIQVGGERTMPKELCG